MSSACYLASLSGAGGASRIACDPAVLSGRTVIKGTRISVEFILRELATGKTAFDLIDFCPTLTPDDILAALAYAADVLCYDSQASAWIRTMNVRRGAP